LALRLSVVVKSLLGLCLLSFSLQAQRAMKIGDWETYLPQREGNWVTQSNTKIYYSTGRSVLAFDKKDMSIEEISRQDGLTETLIDKVTFDNFNNQLIITYQSGNIDVLTDKEIINLPYIKENNNITTQRKINDVIIVNKDLAFLATDFGIIEWDLSKQEFRSTIFTKLKVNFIKVYKEEVFAALEDGLYKIKLSDPLKINFGRWQLLDGKNGLTALYNPKALTVWNDKLYAALEDGIFESSNGSSFTKNSAISAPSGFSLKFMSGDRKHLILGWRNQGFETITQAFTASGQILPAGDNCANLVIYGIEDEQSRIWFADQWRGLRHTMMGLNSGCVRSEFASPFYHTATEIEIKNGKVYVASGGATEDLNPLSNRNGIYVLDSNRWTNIVGAFNPELEQSDYHNFYGIATHPTKDLLYVASFYSGIMAVNTKTNKLTFYNSKNAPLDPGLPWVADLAFDKDQNLWATHTNAEKNILTLTKDSLWFAFKPPITGRKLGRIAIDNRGYKWIQVAGTPGGVLVYDSGQRINDPSDDRYRYFDNNSSVIEGNKIYCIKVDKDGRVWVGTNSGPVIFDCNPFDQNCKGTLKKVLQGTDVGFLLKSEEILSIEVDGGNRKWFGTRNGIFVQSADADDQVLQLRMDNSPLLDNQIYTLKHNDKTGIMYIGSQNGIQAYQTETFGADRSHSSDVYTFPNPVRPEYNGLISIRGLGRDALVKITDINGVLIHQTRALGGQANWDGIDHSGKRAAPGVYLVFSSSQLSFETSDSYVTKFVIIGR
jgi:hypothetical protein